MNIGMVCYPSVGGSGIVATELGKQLANRGHSVHFVSSDLPFRLTSFHENVYFHQVETPHHPVFKEPPYILTLSNKLVQVARQVKLDLIHAHYAVPHATAAYLAKEMLRPNGPRIITTLHGTDITLLGSDPSFAEAIAFSINSSDGVTAVSQSLKQLTMENLPIERDIRVIPNFLECEEYHRVDCPKLRERFAAPGEKILMHMSNFRQVKRVDTVLSVFARVVRDVPSRLILIGDGPEMPNICRLVREMGLRDRVFFLGNQEKVIEPLSIADVFLLPSVKESFGLAALEAMACETPVVASNIGGLPEVISDGESGFLCNPDDVSGMAQRVAELLGNAELHRRIARAGRRRVLQKFCAGRVVPEYEEYYREVLAGRT